MKDLDDWAEIHTYIHTYRRGNICDVLKFESASPSNTIVCGCPLLARRALRPFGGRPLADRILAGVKFAGSRASREPITGVCSKELATPLRAKNGVDGNSEPELSATINKLQNNFYRQLCQNLI